MMDGLLLRPSRPALSIDSTFVQRAFGSGGPNGHIVATYTEVKLLTTSTSQEVTNINQFL